MENLLMTPGPTPLPEKVREVMAKPIIHHRTPQYKEIFTEVNDLLKYVFKTKNNVLTFASSGTGAMDASVVNLLSKTDKALVVRGGKFGERFGDICNAYGVEVIPLDIEWGNAVDPKDIRKILDKNSKIKAVFTTLCETSTAVLNDIKAIAEVVNNYDALLVVDAISGLCADDLQMDNWGVDVVIGGSQKALMLPPGLSFIGLGQRAIKRIGKTDLPKFYFDFDKALKSVVNNDTPFTPAITLVIALRESLKIVREKTIEGVIENCSKLAGLTRNLAVDRKMKIFSKSPSNAVTAINVPEGVDGKKLISTLRDEYGVTFAGGQAQLAGKIFRISHMGCVTEDNIKQAFNIMDIVIEKIK